MFFLLLHIQQVCSMNGSFLLPLPRLRLLLLLLLLLLSLSLLPSLPLLRYVPFVCPSVFPCMSDLSHFLSVCSSLSLYLFKKFLSLHSLPMCVSLQLPSLVLSLSLSLSSLSLLSLVSSLFSLILPTQRGLSRIYT